MRKPITRKEVKKAGSLREVYENRAGAGNQRMAKIVKRMNKVNPTAEAIARAKKAAEAKRLKEKKMADAKKRMAERIKKAAKKRAGSLANRALKIK